MWQKVSPNMCDTMSLPLLMKVRMKMEIDYQKESKTNVAQTMNINRWWARKAVELIINEGHECFCGHHRSFLIKVICGKAKGIAQHSLIYAVHKFISHVITFLFRLWQIWNNVQNIRNAMKIEWRIFRNRREKKNSHHIFTTIARRQKAKKFSSF